MPTQHRTYNNPRLDILFLRFRYLGLDTQKCIWNQIVGNETTRHPQQIMSHHRQCDEGEWSHIYVRTSRRGPDNLRCEGILSIMHQQTSFSIHFYFSTTRTFWRLCAFGSLRLKIGFLGVYLNLKSEYNCVSVYLNLNFHAQLLHNIIHSPD